MSDAVWIILIGALAGVSNALLGSLLVLRRMSMLGDAISHSVLFGIVLAFLVSGSRSPLLMLLGAGGVGILTAYLTSFLHRHGKLQEDASMGVVFTWLFAIGVILIAVYARSIDLDQDCVLHGEIAFAPFERVHLGENDIGPRAFWMLLIITAANLLFVVGAFHRLKVFVFDPQFAATAGFPVMRWHYLLMTLVSLTVVASFEAVGAILVVAMLAVPASAALLLSSGLHQMLWISCMIAVASSLGGYWFAAQLDGSVSAAMALCGGAFFVAALIMSKLSRGSSKKRQQNCGSTPPGRP